NRHQPIVECVEPYESHSAVGTPAVKGRAGKVGSPGPLCVSQHRWPRFLVTMAPCPDSRLVFAATLVALAVLPNVVHVLRATYQAPHVVPERPVIQVVLVDRNLTYLETPSANRGVPCPGQCGLGAARPAAAGGTTVPVGAGSPSNCVIRRFLIGSSFDPQSRLSSMIACPNKAC